jgi:hypothetical protein
LLVENMRQTERSAVAACTALLAFADEHPRQTFLFDALATVYAQCSDPLRFVTPITGREACRLLSNGSGFVRAQVTKALQAFGSRADARTGAIFQGHQRWLHTVESIRRSVKHRAGAGMLEKCTALVNKVVEETANPTQAWLQLQKGFVDTFPDGTTAESNFECGEAAELVWTAHAAARIYFAAFIPAPLKATAVSVALTRRMLQKTVSRVRAAALVKSDGMLQRGGRNMVNTFARVHRTRAGYWVIKTFVYVAPAALRAYMRSNGMLAD